MTALLEYLNLILQDIGQKVGAMPSAYASILSFKTLARKWGPCPLPMITLLNHIKSLHNNQNF